jgi:hypothetical protein
MLAILNNPDAPETRKDQMAIAAAPFLHPRLAMTASADGTNGGGAIASVTVISLPHGCQYDPTSGLIRYPDGLECSPPAFQPALPSPDIGELLAPAAPEVLPEPLEVLEPAADDGKLVVLNAHRRRDSDVPSQDSETIPRKRSNGRHWRTVSRCWGSKGEAAAP